MADTNTNLIRPHYFDRQQLTAADLNAEQQYFRERLRRHNRFMHGWGVVCGAQVTRASGDDPWEIAIGEGYAVTPHGDEIYIPSGTTFNTRLGVESCLGVSSPCPNPEDLSGTVKEGVLRIVRANIDPIGKDVGNNYNEEWVDILVLETTNLNNYVLRHVINPGTPREGQETYYSFSEREPFTAGTVVRIHSGAQRHHTAPEPEFVHRYRASQIGNWRLNNTGDTIFVLNAHGQYVTSASFLPESLIPIAEGIVFLVACPAEALCCPRPGLPAQCQPPGGLYEYSRICETIQFRIVCVPPPPPSHSKGDVSCEELKDVVCKHAHVQCPQATAEDDNCVVLARIAVGGDSIIAPDDTPGELSHRRQLLSESLLLAYSQCQCEIAPPVANFTGTPTLEQAPLTVSFDNQSTGIYTACRWNYGDETLSGECEDHKHTYTQPGVYTVSLTVDGPGGTNTATRTNYITVHPALSACALEILERGTIHVALHESFDWPFAFTERLSQRVGFLSDLIEKMVERLFEIPVNVELSLIDDNQYLTSLAAGNAPDLYMPRIPENLRQALELWTSNYFLDGLRLLIDPALWKRSGLDPNEIKAWDGATIGVREGEETTEGILITVAANANIRIGIKRLGFRDNPLTLLSQGSIR
ncbi:MAG: PKD domain-containing protein, partial [Anaerolineae bacterium]|nr:PKD domain-containing protein [Anaerolineae bacterium]